MWQLLIHAVAKILGQMVLRKGAGGAGNALDGLFACAQNKRSIREIMLPYAAPDRRVRLRDINMSQMSLIGAQTPGADLTGVDFSGSDLRTVNFAGAKLDGANL